MVKFAMIVFIAVMAGVCIVAAVESNVQCETKECKQAHECLMICG
jgi:hypothetical protein